MVKFPVKWHMWPGRGMFMERFIRLILTENRALRQHDTGQVTCEGWQEDSGRIWVFRLSPKRLPLHVGPLQGINVQRASNLCVSIQQVFCHYTEQHQVLCRMPELWSSTLKFPFIWPPSRAFRAGPVTARPHLSSPLLSSPCVLPSPLLSQSPFFFNLTSDLFQARIYDWKGGKER